MLAFRSEAHLDVWLAESGSARGAVLDVGQARALGSAWFGDSLDADWQPRTVAQSQAIFASLGLTGPFWQLPPG